MSFGETLSVVCPTPLVAGDLHRHLEGAIRPTTAAELAARHGLDLGLDDVAAAITTTRALPGLAAYLAKIDIATSTVRTLEEWTRVTEEAVEDAGNEPVSHLELRFSPLLVRDRCGLAPEAVVDAVAEGAHQGSQRHGLPVGLIGVLLRDLGPDQAATELDVLLSRRDLLCGIDLAGNEQGVPAELFTTHFTRAREAGLHTTVHAGESVGSSSVRAALRHLRPERIGHGIRSVDDPGVLDELAVRGVTLEVAPTSNVHTAAVSGYEAHPLPRLLAAGVRVALCTDDPATSRTRLPDEYARAAELGLDSVALAQVAARSRTAAFVPLPDENVQQRLSCQPTSQ